jgi:N-acyl-D-amino-acid deacylase
MRRPAETWDNLYRSAGSPENVLLLQFKNAALKPLTGKTLAAVARERGTSPEETALDLVIEDDSRVGCAYFLMSEENVHRQIGLAWMAFASDAGSLAPEGPFLLSNPHPRAYGTFARVLGHYVREERLLTLEEAVHKMTGASAPRFGLRGRGELRDGWAADLVVLDPEKVTDAATYEDPLLPPTGVHAVVVAGRVVVEDGEVQDARPGRVLVSS